MRNNQIKKLKTQHVWPSLVFLIITLVSGILLVALCSVSIFSVLFESQYIQAKEHIDAYEKLVNDRLEQGVKAEVALRDITLHDPQVQELFLINKDKKVVSGTDLCNIDFSKHGEVLLSDDAAFYLYKDTPENLVWINNKNQLTFSFNAVIDKLFLDDDLFDKNWFIRNGLILKVGIAIPLKTPEYTLVAGSNIAISRLEILAIGVALVIMVLFMVIPLLFMFCNVISNVRHQKKLRNVLYLDTLTGGHNWLYFKDHGKKILGKSRNRSKTFVIVDLELMKYRSLCSCYGVTEGERVLEYIYLTINRVLTKNETIARYGRANFALLLECKSPEHADYKISSLIELVKNAAGSHRTIYHAGYNVLPPIHTADGKIQKRKDYDVANLYNLASAARASVHDHEDNAIAAFTDALLEEQRWEHTVEDRMEAALYNQEFQVYYQPKYDPNTNKLAGAEALIRWISPTDGLISPGRFIPIFEKNGFITKIDDYMISNVSKQQAAWLKEGKNIVPVSVNVSRAHFTQPDLAEHILALVDAHQVPHKYIEIELTESAFFDDKNVLLNTVLKLKNYGFEISMDDFGAGYSSLNSLKDLPLDVLKLDAEFFRGDNSEGDRAQIVVSEAISLAKQLNMRIVAEGIEKKEQVDFLATQGCDMIQGFYFARPMPANEYEERMGTGATQPASGVALSE